MHDPRSPTGAKPLAWIDRGDVVHGAALPPQAGGGRGRGGQEEGRWKNAEIYTGAKPLAWIARGDAVHERTMRQSCRGGGVTCMSGRYAGLDAGTLALLLAGRGAGPGSREKGGVVGW